MAKLINADELTATIENTDWYHISLQGNLVRGARSDIHTPLYKADDIYQAIENAPAVDAVPVIRCKDCKHWAFTRACDGGVIQGDCKNPRFWMPDTVDPTMYAHEFCALGERETNDKT